MHTISGNAVAVSLQGAQTVAEIRQRVAVALGMDGREFVQVKLFNGRDEVDDSVAPDTLHMDAGLLAVLDRVIPDWCPRGRYMYHDKEVLRITGNAQTPSAFVAEFVDGSVDNVVPALLEQAVDEWLWKTVRRQGRVWAHPPEKPAESGGWYDIFTAENVRQGAVGGAGLISGFCLGLAGPETNLNFLEGDGTFTTSFNVGFVGGFTMWAGYQLLRVASHFCKK